MSKTMATPMKTKSTSMNPKVKGTYGTMYYVQDMSRSVKWFQQQLNLKPAFQSPDWTEFNIGGPSLCLHLGNDRKEFENGVVIIHVDAIRRMVEDLKSKGAKVLGDVHEVHPGAYSAMVADPDGNVISLYEGPKSC